MMDDFSWRSDEYNSGYESGWKAAEGFEIAFTWFLLLVSLVISYLLRVSFTWVVFGVFLGYTLKWYLGEFREVEE